MPLTKAQKKEIIDIFKGVDVKQLEIGGDFTQKEIKMFRFGSYNGLSIASEIIKAIAEPKADMPEPNETDTITKGI